MVDCRGAVATSRILACLAIVLPFAIISSAMLMAEARKPVIDRCRFSNMASLLLLGTGIVLGLWVMLRRPT
jgi:hypothetical protein